MKIEQIQLKDFKNFTELDIAFEEGVNLFVGKNSSGKTTILEAINVASGGFFASRGQKYQRYIEEREIRLANRLRQPYASVIARSTVIGNPWSRRKNSDGKNDSSNLASIKEYGERFYNAFEDRENRDVAPIIAYYSTKRLFSDAKLSKEQKYDPLNGRRNGYIQCLEENAIKTLLDNWLGNAVTTRATKAINNIIDEDRVLTNVEKAIKFTLAEFLNLPDGFQLKMFQDTQFNNELFLQVNTEEPLPLSYYSDGFRNLLYLIIDMMWRASQLNPWMTMEEIRANLTGVVTIDEIDLHLHPTWQAKAVNLVRNLFSKVQFFITTHSPTVVANFEGGTLYVLEHASVRRYNAKYFGKEIDSVLRNVLNASDRHKPTQDKINRLFRMIDDNTPENEITNLLQELNELLGPDDKDLQTVSALIDYNQNQNQNAIHPED